MKHLLGATALVAALVALASPAAAQIAGTYTGTSADGQLVYIVVGTDPFTSAPAIEGAGIYFNAACKGKSGTVLSSSIGYNPNADLVGNQVTSNYDISFIASTFTLTFDDNTSSATGTITTYAPDLFPVGGVKPTKSLFCVSKKQALTLTYTGMARGAKLPPGAFMLLSPKH